MRQDQTHELKCSNEQLWAEQKHKDQGIDTGIASAAELMQAKHAVAMLVNPQMLPATCLGLTGGVLPSASNHYQHRRIQNFQSSRDEEKQPEGTVKLFSRHRIATSKESQD
jgi:hypothetical protein